MTYHAALTRARALDAESRFHEALAAFDAAKALSTDRVEAASCDGEAAYVLLTLARPHEALERLVAARASLARTGEILERAHLDRALGATYDDLGRYDDALRAHRRARRVYGREGCYDAVSTCDMEIGMVLSDLGRYNAAVASFARALDGAGDADDEARILHNLSSALRGAGRRDEALACSRRARDIWDRLDDTKGVAHCDFSIANDINHDDPDAAIALYRSAQETYRALGMLAPAADCADSIGAVLVDQGRYEEALDYHRSARIVYEREGLDVRGAICDGNLGHVLDHLGRLEEALERYRASRATYTELGRPYDVASCELCEACVLVNLGRRDEALSIAVRALETLESHPRTSTVAWAHHVVADAYRLMRRESDAAPHFAKARELYLSVGEDKRAAECEGTDITLLVHQHGRDGREAAP